LSYRLVVYSDQAGAFEGMYSFWAKYTTGT
jgi:hypothetical protein